MNNKFDLERFKAGEPAYYDTKEFSFVGMLKSDKEFPVLGEDGYSLYRFNKDGKYKNATVQGLSMKPVLKKVDWSKLPVDTLINTKVGVRHFAGLLNKSCISYFNDGATSDIRVGYCSLGISDASIHDKQPWTVWLGGNDSPIPDGLEFEYMVHEQPGVVASGSTNASEFLWRARIIYAYRLTGKTLEGYTL